MTLAEKLRQFAALPLHDATLIRLCLDWRQRTCTAEINAVVSTQLDTVSHLLMWAGVREARIPQDEPWGPSVYINAARFEAPNLYLIEMQSGDLIAITAESYSFVATPV